MNDDSDHTSIGGEKEIRYQASQVRLLLVDILENICKHEVTIDRIPTLFQQPSADKPILTLSDLCDEFEQFRIWARNIGVFASDNASLDYRLREAFEVKDGVVALLQSLLTHLRDGRSHGKRPVPADVCQLHCCSNKIEPTRSSPDLRRTTPKMRATRTATVKI